jgi:hypothetical protein
VEECKIRNLEAVRVPHARPEVLAFEVFPVPEIGALSVGVECVGVRFESHGITNENTDHYGQCHLGGGGGGGGGGEE